MEPIDTTKLKLEFNNLLKENNKEKLDNFDKKIIYCLSDANNRINIITKFRDELNNIHQNIKNTHNNKLYHIDDKQIVVIKSKTNIRFTNKKYEIESYFSEDKYYYYKININSIPNEQNINISGNTFHLKLDCDDIYVIVIEYINENIGSFLKEGIIICKKR